VDRRQTASGFPHHQPVSLRTHERGAGEGFTAVLQFLADEKYVNLDHYFVDGTKIEANANRYTKKVPTLFATITDAEKQEEQEHSGADLPELGKAASITSEKLEKAVQQLEDKLQEQPKDKSLKKAVRTLRKDLLPRLQKVREPTRNPRQPEQFQQNRPRCDVHADERRSHAQRAN